MKTSAAGLVASVVLFSSTTALACPQCRPAVKAEVYNQNFAATLFVLGLPLAVLLAIGVAIYFWDTLISKLHKGKKVESWHTTHDAAR